MHIVLSTLMPIADTHLFIDFDSTFNQVEALDNLIEITIHDSEKKEKVMNEIATITDLGMAGKLNYMESLKQRLNLLDAYKKDVEQLSEQLYQTITESFVQHQQFFQQNRDHISIISNGFKDFILPVVTKFGLHPHQVYANSFLYNQQNKVIGVDENNPLSREAGKPKVIQQLQIKEKIIMIGDGYNDYQVKKEGCCDTFILFTENVLRENMVQYADVVASNFAEVLKYLNYE